MSIQLVVFDMAGTTVNDDGIVNDCLRDVLSAAGVAVTRQEVDDVMGEPKPMAIAKLLARESRPALPADAEEVLALYGAFERLMLDHYRHNPRVRAAAGAEATFLALKQQGIHVALDTGFHRVIVDAIVERLGWRDQSLIDATVASDEVDRGRPYADLIGRAMLLTGVTSGAQVAKVGDTPADLLEGTAAGCARVIGITTGAHSRAALARYPHTDIVDRLDEVAALCTFDRERR